MKRGEVVATGWKYSAVFCIPLYDPAALASLVAERDAALAQRTYAHMCRSDHAEIGHNVSDDDERCPLCRVRNECDYYRGRDEAGAEREREAITRAESAKAARDALQEALRNLVVKLDAVKGPADGVFVFASIHGYHYTGPTYEAELAAARTLSVKPK